ncbi:protein-associating with the carboxyl-terminal domain of ezrin [Scaptodrosophila lebanonensis]|uniref:Protein-associating with the carboxyl-terminal domain of ezrin n=1 Tax=Drosophila lebanonensis TaxID=7225 RepID=A0A6J2TQH0_DROLE|nr:protein-associating with the carboxyl-terminal domain of ezrin [Scaptodrosophila lebanonensis]
MGNEGSKLKGLIIEKNAVEVNDFWALHDAESPTTSNEDGRQLLSIFQGEPGPSEIKGQLWKQGGPIDRAIRNLMIYRHPYILKYVATWVQSGQKHLATERVRPLSNVLAQQSDIQICLGLRTILCSLIFLIEKAMARHLNICNQSVYVTDNGSWRLGGFEYVWKAKEVNEQLLDFAQPFRYQPAIDERNKEQLEAFEQFAFATLCEQILEKCSKRNEDEGGGDANTPTTPHVQEFRAYCSTHLKHSNTELRPKLSAVLLHPYFNHEFVLIHSFLFELPLKSVQERQQFFTTLIDRLRCFDEQVVASQLASDLLSRMVLLDPTAQNCVTTYVLSTKTENGTAALFSQQTYVQYVLPHILKMFRLRDAQIRLILLEYFMEYVRLLSDEQLQREILPHLLMGMNDTNDVLVSKTLHSLADLVPILGAATVLGGKRSRFFSDGRPHAAVSTESNADWVEPRSITPVMNGSAGDGDEYMVSGSPLPAENATPLSMQLRLSPDGGEDDKSIGNITDALSSRPLENSTDSSISSHTHSSSVTHEQTLVDDDAWSDWDTNDELQRLHVKRLDDNDTDDAPTAIHNAEEMALSNLETNSSASSHATQTTQQSLTDSYRTACSTMSTANSHTSKVPVKKVIDDLSALDIQVQPKTATGNQDTTEFDFFKDMEPVIEAKSQSSEQEIVQINVNRFAADTTATNGLDLDAEADQGWGMDDDDVVWGEDTAENAT